MYCITYAHFFPSTYRMVSFMIVFIRTGDDCNSVDEFNEGVEFSARLLSKPNEWIPLKYIYYRGDEDTRTDEIHMDESNIRGYMVEQTRLSEDNSSTNATIDICNFNVSDFIQFRWLQTSSVDSGLQDVWILDNIKISIATSEHGNITILSETFDLRMLK